jgi:hypothetical protein
MPLSQKLQLTLQDEPTIAHEIGHTFNNKHASCDHGEDGGGDCEPAPSKFPCPHGGICISAAEQDEPLAFNTFNLAVLPPRTSSSHAHDFMSYGANSWISPHTYRRIFDKLGSPVRSSLQSAPATIQTGQPNDSRLSLSPQLVLYVSGLIEQPGNIATLNRIYQLSLNVVPNEGAGAFSLELHDSIGRLLNRRRFDAIRIGDEEEGTSFNFFQMVAFSNDAARLVLKAGDNILAERSRTSNAPRVEVLAPAGGEVWQGRQTIQWEASDLDGDSLVYTVQYSKDLGKTWQTLALNLSQLSFEVDTALFGGSKQGQAIIRVFASDGFNSSVDQSAPFTVSDKLPHVRILTPKDGAVFSSRQLIDFIGAAMDLEDGSLEDSAYSWSSDRQGELGQGHEFRLRTLSSGQHIITLTARDSDGRTSSASITISVLEQLNTQPIADPGPNRIVTVGTEVRLDGGASFDPDGDSLNFSWRFVSIPSGAVVPIVLQNATSATPSFLASVAGKYVIELVVRDGKVNGFPSQIAIEAVYNCHIICLRSPQYWLLNLDRLPDTLVLVGGGINAQVSTSNVTAIRLALTGGPTPRQRFNRGFVAAQLSLGAIGPPVAIFNGHLSCFGQALTNFSPVVLSDGVTLTPNSKFIDLFAQARIAVQNPQTSAADLLALAELFDLLNGKDPIGRCGQ